VSVLIDGGTSTAVLGVGAEAGSAAHVEVRPIAMNFNDEYAGHFRTGGRFVFPIASQLSNSRLVELRNIGSQLIIPTRFRLTWTQTGAFTAAQLYNIHLWRIYQTTTSPNNRVVPVITPKRTIGLNPPISSAQMAALLAAGNASGMTGSVSTIDERPIASVGIWFTAAISTTNVNQATFELLDDVNGTHPIVLGRNEGLLLRGEQAGNTASQGSLVWDLCWCETKAY
jgi:hypothetical protein